MTNDWKSVIVVQNGVEYDFSEVYEANSDGQIRSLSRYIGAKKGSKSFIKGKILAGGTCARYRIIRLMDGKKANTFRIARIIAQLFIPNPENKGEVNHKNGIRFDDRVENLEWVTPLENIRHAWANGFVKKVFGENHHNFGKPVKGGEKYRFKKRDIPLPKKVSKLRWKLVLNTNTGIYYDTIEEAAKTTGISPSYLSKKLRMRYLNNTPFIMA